jgi:hypothetical protein
MIQNDTIKCRKKKGGWSVARGRRERNPDHRVGMIILVPENLFSERLP